MLVGLRLQNVALIDSLELTFQQGFTVLTGETGAGKSLLLDALDALFGGKQSLSVSRLLRPGSTTGHIEATFSVNAAVDYWLNSEGFEAEDNEILVTREWRLKEARLTNRCRLNGIVINRQQIAALRPLLIDLTVQGQTQQLFSTSNQLLWLDRLGALSAKETLDEVKKSWNVWYQAFLSLEKALLEQDERKKHFQDLEDLLKELNEAELNDPCEDRKLEIEEDRLVNGVRLREGLVVLLSRLYEGSDEFPSVVDQVGVCMQELKSLIKLDISLTNCFDKTFNLYTEFNELISQLQEYGSLLESDSSRLDQVQERLVKLKRLQKCHNLDLPQLLQRRDELRVSHLSNDIEALIKKLKVNEELAREKRDRNNLTLTKVRKEVALQFESDLMKYLRPLGLLNVCFKVQVNESKPNEKGADTVQFLFSANPGQSLAPLVDVASGGEMSRFLLALKTVLSQVDGSSTLLFDEIDSGVSGRVSGAIAHVLKDLAAKRQVFCVTHQPLVAAVAHHHFRVVKFVENGVTRSDVSCLSNMEDRQSELAELAGGDFAEARVYAASLLDQQAA